MSVGEIIKRMRIEKGLTQKQLGHLCGMADSAIRRYENGRANPKNETLQKIASGLGVPLIDLMYGPGAGEKLYNSMDPDIRKEVEKQEILHYSIMKALESIYGRAVGMDVSIYEKSSFSGSGYYVSIGDGNNKIAIADQDFDKILKLVEGVLKDSVSMLGEDELVFLSNWRNEAAIDSLETKHAEYVKLSVVLQNGNKDSHCE